MTRSCIFAALALMMVFISQAARADDTVNPAFSSWSSFAVGSSATLEGTADTVRGQMVTTTTRKLVEKGDDHIVIETVTTVVMAGMTSAQPAVKTTISAAFDPSNEMTQIGTEDVAAAGKTFSCKIYAAAHPDPKKTNKVKIWASTDVPGGEVKLEIDTGTIKVTQLLKSLEVK